VGLIMQSYNDVNSGQFIPFDMSVGHIHAMGLTFAQHTRESGEKLGTPVVFSKHCSPSPATDSTLALPSSAVLSNILRTLDSPLADWLSSQVSEIPLLLDYEVEIAMLLLEDINYEHLQPGNPPPRIGFLVVNDLTTRSLQIAGEGAVDRFAFWSASKSLPGFLPTTERVWVPNEASFDEWPNVTLECRVNGELRQSAALQNLMYTPRQLLRHALDSSPDCQLRRHDLILTGTPAGVALSAPAWKRKLASLLPRKQRILLAWNLNHRQPRFLQPGDQLEFGASWLGSRKLTILPTEEAHGLRS
jgi:2-keto-4-pentenoate hydratase/2-oxohepta-3-ene-1,7-dioic acid hydratase in catechol pathway